MKHADQETLRLPVELIERILLDLDGQDVVRCQTVSKLFLDLVQNSVRLQYKLECFAAGVCSHVEDTTSVDVRLQSLREWCSYWRRTEWSHSRNVIQLTGLREFLSEDTMFRVAATRDRVSFNQIPSLTRKIAQAQWETGSFDYQTPGVHYDHAQDLVVVPLLVNPNEVRIHLLTSEGRPHPDASVPIITAHSTQPIRHFTTLVLSNLFAVVSPGTHAWVWNWREVKLLFELDAMVFTHFWAKGFAIIDDRHFVLPGRHGTESPGSLIFLDCYAAPSKTYRLLSDVLDDAVLILHLPPLAPSAELRNISLSTTGYSPESDALSASRSKALFYPSAQSSIVSIELWVTRLNDTQVNFIPLVASLSAILSLISTHSASSDPTVDIRWETWAQYTRFIPEDVIVWPNIGVCRSRFAARQRRKVPGEDRMETFVTLLEFDSSPSMRRDIASGDPRVTSTIVTEPTVADPRYMDATVATYLPYRKIATDIPVPNDHRIYVGDHSIALVPWGNTDSTEAYYYCI